MGTLGVSSFETTGMEFWWIMECWVKHWRWLSMGIWGFQVRRQLREVHVVVGVVEGQSDVIVDVAAVLDGSGVRKAEAIKSSNTQRFSKMALRNLVCSECRGTVEISWNLLKTVERLNKGWSILSGLSPYPSSDLVASMAMLPLFPHCWHHPYCLSIWSEQCSRHPYLS